MSQTAEPTQQQQTPPTASPRTPPFRSSFFSWVATDEKQLEDTEVILLDPLYKIGYEQFRSEGLNTVLLKATNAVFDFTETRKRQIAARDKKAAESSWFGGSSSSSSCSNKNNNNNNSTTSATSAPTTGAQKHEDAAQDNELQIQIPQNKKVYVKFNFQVYVHGFAGSIVNWLPNLKNIGNIVNERNAKQLKKALNFLTSSTSNQNQNQQQQHGKGGNKKNQKQNDDDASQQNNEEQSIDIELTILSAFDVPGFARSKRDQITFEGPDHVLRYMTWCFDRWFSDMKINNTATSTSSTVPTSNTIEQSLLKWIRLVNPNSKTEIEKFNADPTYETPILSSLKKACFLPYSAKNTAASAKKVPDHHVTILGHSYGAMLSSHFTARFPERVHHLILCDPFGVPIYDPTNEKHSLESSTINWKFRLAAKLLLGTFESALSPALRILGPMAPGFIEKMRPDFLERWEGQVEDPKMILDFIYHCNAQKDNTGDHSMAKSIILGSRGLVHRPIFNVIGGAHELKMRAESNLPESKFSKQYTLQHDFSLQYVPSKIKVSLCYGNQTWMDKAQGFAMIEERKSKLGGETVGLVDQISGAGHQVNTDNAPEFDDFVLKACGMK